MPVCLDLDPGLPAAAGDAERLRTARVNLIENARHAVHGGAGGAGGGRPAPDGPLVRKHARRTGRRVDRVEDGALQGLLQYDWPGNVRELENTIERAVVLSPGPAITARAVAPFGAAAPQATGLPSPRLRQNIEWVERETIRRALESAGGVKKEAAELMGISQRALSYYLGKYRID
ncbi:MAG: hypothetical protein IT176_01940 [Acidobacteria bacterium]|nr:hypothetical protein [Acidobacteriota bacterium]